MKKRYLIMLIIAIVLVITLGAGFAFAYFFTDSFKSNKQLFTKYISQNKELFSFFEDADLKSYVEKQKNTPYTSEGTIKTNVTFPDSSNAKIAKALQNCNILINEKIDNINNYSYQTIKANYSDTQSIQFDLYKNGDIYAAKISEILFKYVGINNNNLKEFATKMQLPEEITSKIPNKINFNDISKSLNVYNNDDMTALKEKYIKIITDNLTDDMFSKENNSEETIYTLTIKESQLKNILVKILESLKEDEVIINKFKENLINNYNFTEDNIETYITQYKEVIQRVIDNIKNNEDAIYPQIEPSIKDVTNSNNINTTDDFTDILQEPTNTIDSNMSTEGNNENILAEEPTNTNNNDTEKDNNITIKVYSSKGKILKTEIKLDELGSLIISKSDDGAKLEIIKDTKTLFSTYAQKLKYPNETKYEFSFSYDSSEILNLTTSFSGLDTDSVNENSELTFDMNLNNSSITDAKTKFVFNYKTTKTFGEIKKPDIKNTDILLLNSAPARANVEKLYDTVLQKFVELNKSKLNAIGLTETDNPFIYYIPSVIPISVNHIIQSPEKSPYYAIPLVATGVSVSMLSGDNAILSRASNASINNELSQVKEEIMLTLNSDISNYYSEKYSEKSTKLESLEKVIDKALKNFTPSNPDIEYKYKKKTITLKSKKTPTKLITGKVSNEGKIDWTETIEE